MDLYLCSPSELEEMGFPPPCRCLAVYRQPDDSTGEIYEVCDDCGASRRTTRRVLAWA